jgi:tetratricopeptide (TPR) repeat protein
MLGQALLLMNQSQEALRELRAAVALKPDSPLSHHYLGAALLRELNFDAAMNEFRESLLVLIFPVNSLFAIQLISVVSRRMKIKIPFVPKNVREMKSLSRTIKISDAKKRASKHKPLSTRCLMRFVQSDGKIDSVVFQ